MLTWGRLSRWGELHQDCGAEALDPSPDEAASICGSQSVLLGSVHVASLQGLSYEHRIPSAVLFQALGQSTLPLLGRRGLRAQEVTRVPSVTSSPPSSPNRPCGLDLCPSPPWGFWELAKLASGIVDGLGLTMVPRVLADSEAGEHHAVCSMLRGEAEGEEDERNRVLDLPGTIHL